MNQISQGFNMRLLHVRLFLTTDFHQFIFFVVVVLWYSYGHIETVS